jgi:F0F1-type ATP synthase membrane subunit b/b'
LSRARREAEQIVSSARTQADSLGTTAQAEAQRELAGIRAEVDRISKRRDAITAQLASLRDVVAGFSSDDSDDDDKAGA